MKDITGQIKGTVSRGRYPGEERNIGGFKGLYASCTFP